MIYHFYYLDTKQYAGLGPLNSVDLTQVGYTEMEPPDITDPVEGFILSETRYWTGTEWEIRTI